MGCFLDCRLSMSMFSGYKWVSGDGFSYANWKTGEPNDWDGLEPCVMMDGADGLWNDEKCFIPMNWICSVSRGIYYI